VSPAKRKPKTHLIPAAGSEKDLRFIIYVRIHNLFATYLNLNCFFISADKRDWKPLFYSHNKRNPTHFEDFFGKIKERWKFNQVYFDRLEKEKRILIGKHQGFNEMFAPVVFGGTLHGFLATGSFVRAPFTDAEISRQWADLTGHSGGFQESDFLSYARMALDTVVLAPGALEGCKELLEILADYMCGRVDGKMAERLEALRKGGISHCLPHFIWMDFMLGMDKFFPRMNAGGALQKWETEELGITRYPTTVLAVTYQTPEPERWSALKSMVSASRLQWEALSVAREFPETVAGKLEDYGALFVTSASPSKSRVQAKLEIRDRMEAIRKRLEKKTGLKVLAGIGSTLDPGNKLAESRQQAVLAMNLCASTGRTIIFYEDYAEKVPHWQGRGLRPALERLRKAYQGGLPQEREMARVEFIRQALVYTNERNESLRFCLLETFFVLADSLRGRLIPEEHVDILADSLEKRFLNASSIQEMLSLFSEGLEKIGKAGDRPSEAGRLARMEQIKQYVDRHFTQPLRLGDLADRAGLSKSAFLRGFYKTTGRGFSQYLQGLRLDEARRLLRASPLTVGRVAQESGFNSASYFVQAFKRATGFSPNVYREREQVKPAG
jgi:AraC-like DNA-binding protein